MADFSLSPHFVVDDSGKRISVVLPIEEYESLLEILEDLEDLEMYEVVKSRNEEYMPFSEFRAQLKSLDHAV